MGGWTKPGSCFGKRADWSWFGGGGRLGESTDLGARRRRLGKSTELGELRARASERGWEVLRKVRGIYEW